MKFALAIVLVLIGSQASAETVAQQYDQSVYAVPKAVAHAKKVTASSQPAVKDIYHLRQKLTGGGLVSCPGDGSFWSEGIELSEKSVGHDKYSFVLGQQISATQFKVKRGSDGKTGLLQAMGSNKGWRVGVTMPGEGTVYAECYSLNNSPY